MKRLITMLAIIAMLALGATSCKKSEPKQKMIDPMTKMIVLVKEGKGLKQANATTTISVEECMRRANGMLFTLKGRDYPSTMLIDESRKDYEKNALKLEAFNIILDGKLDPFLGTASEFIILHDKLPKADTIGYIPNKTVHEAYARAVQAFNEERYEDVVHIFTSAFVAHPITGEQYKTLKAQGLN